MLLLLAVIAALTFRDYGLGWDDFTHAQYGDLLLSLYTSGFRDTRALSFVNLYLYGGGFDMAAGALAKLLPFDLFETRRLVERAKKVLMTRLAISEGEAFLQILTRAQSSGRSLGETAWTIIETDEILPRLDVAHALELIFHAVRPQLRPKPRRPLSIPTDPATVPDVDAESYRSPALNG